MGERLSSVFWPGGTLISASAAPRRGKKKKKKKTKKKEKKWELDDRVGRNGRQSSWHETQHTEPYSYVLQAVFATRYVYTRGGWYYRR